MKALLIALSLMTFLVGANLALAQDAGPVVDEAAEVVDAPEVDVDFLTDLYAKLKSGEYMMAFGGILVLVVFGVRKVLGYFTDWVKTQLGGYVVSFGTALALAVGTSLLAGQALSVGLIMTALGAAFMASGGWEAANDILSAMLKKKEAEEPA